MAKKNEEVTEEVTNEVAEVVPSVEKKKGKGGLIAILIIIIVLLAGTTVYFAFIRDNKDSKKDNSKSSEKNNNNKKDDNTKDDNTKDDNTTDDNKVKEVSSDELSAIMKKFDKYYLMELIYDNSASFSKDKLTDIQLNMLETYMLGKYSDEWQEHFDDESEWSFSKSEADAYFQDLYGFKPANYRDVICSNDDEALLYFKGDKFVWNDDHPGHGGYTVSYIDYYVADSKVEGSTYTISLVLLYGHEEMGYYINGVSIDDKVDVDSYDEYEQVVAQYKSYFNKHKTEYKNKAYKFTFEKKNGNYYLKSYSK